MKRRLSPPDPPRRSTRIKRPPPKLPTSTAVPLPPRPAPIPRLIITNDPTAPTSTHNPLDPTAPLSTTAPATQTYYLPATEKSDLYTFFRADYARTGYRPTQQQLRAWFAYTHGGRQLPLPVIAAVIGGGNVVGRSAKVGLNMAARIRDWALARKEVMGGVPGVAECMLWMQRVGMEMRGDVDVGEVLRGVVDEEEEGEGAAEGEGEGWMVLDGLGVGGDGERREGRAAAVRRRWEEVVAREAVDEEVEWASCLALPAARCAEHDKRMKEKGLENTTGVTGGWRDGEKGESWDESEDSTESSEENKSDESCAESRQIRSLRRNTRKQNTAPSENSRTSTPSAPPTQSTASKSNTTSSPLKRLTTIKRKHKPTRLTRSTSSQSHTPITCGRPTTRSRGKQPPTRSSTTKSEALEPAGRYSLRSRRSETFVSKSDDESGDEDSEHDADDEESESDEEKEEEEKEEVEDAESEDSMEDTIVCVFRPVGGGGFAGGGSASGGGGGGGGGGCAGRGRKEVLDDTSSCSDDASEDEEAASEDEDEEIAEYQPVCTPEKKHDTDHDITMDGNSSPLSEPTPSDEDPELPTPDVVSSGTDTVADAVGNQLLREHSTSRVARGNNNAINASDAAAAISRPPSGPAPVGERPVVGSPSGGNTSDDAHDNGIPESSPLSELSSLTESPTLTPVRSGTVPTTSASNTGQREKNGKKTESSTTPQQQHFIVEKQYPSPGLDDEGDTPLPDCHSACKALENDGGDDRIVPDSEGDTSDIEMGMHHNTPPNTELPLAPGSLSTPVDAALDSPLRRARTSSLPLHRSIQEGGIMTESQTTLRIAYSVVQYTWDGASSGDIPQAAETATTQQAENAQVMPVVPAHTVANTNPDGERDYDNNDWSSLGDTTVSEGGWDVPDDAHLAPSAAVEPEILSQTNNSDGDGVDEEREAEWDMQGDTTVSEGGWSVPDEAPQLDAVEDDVTAVGGGVMEEDTDPGQGPALFTYLPPAGDEWSCGHYGAIVGDSSQRLVHGQDGRVNIAPCEEAPKDDGNDENSVSSDVLELFETARGIPALICMEGYISASEEEGMPEAEYVEVGGGIPLYEPAERDGGGSAGIKRGTTPAKEVSDGGRGYVILSGGRGIMFREIGDAPGRGKLPVGSMGGNYQRVDEEKHDSTFEPPVLIHVTATEHRHTPTESASDQGSHDATAPGGRRGMQAYVEDASDDETASLVIDLEDYVSPQVVKARSLARSGIDQDATKDGVNEADDLDELDDVRPVRVTAAESRPLGLESSIHADVSRYLDDFDPTVDMNVGGENDVMQDESDGETLEGDEDEEEEEERGRKRKRAIRSSSSSENSGPAVKKTNTAFAPEPNSEAATLPNFAWGEPTRKEIIVAPQEAQLQTVLPPEPNTETATFPNFAWNRPSNSQPSPFHSRITNRHTLHQHIRSLTRSQSTPEPKQAPMTAEIKHAATLLAFSPLHTDFRDMPPPARTHGVVTDREQWSQTRVPEEVVASVGYRTADGRYENETEARVRGTPGYNREPGAGGLESRLRGWYDGESGGVTQRALEVKVEELAEGRALPVGWLEEWKSMHGVVVVVAVGGGMREDPICLDDDDE